VAVSKQAMCVRLYTVLHLKHEQFGGSGDEILRNMPTKIWGAVEEYAVEFHGFSHLAVLTKGFCQSPWKTQDIAEKRR